MSGRSGSTGERVRALPRPRPAAAGVAGLAGLCLLLGRYAGGAAPLVVAGTCLAVLAVSLVLVAVPARGAARVVVTPSHAVAGRRVRGVVSVRHRGPAPLLAPRIEISMPDGRVGLDLPSLWPGATHRASFTAAVSRRGVYRVGDAELARGDPLGLFEWLRRTGTPVELHVRPVTVPLAPLGAAAYDLEGVASDRVSMSELAFHGLREYVRGDDLRHVHWKTSAKADGLLVRQYQDSRRSRVRILLDDEAAAYEEEDDFELAVSVAASVLRQAFLDGAEVSFLHTGEQLVNTDPESALDACCRIDAGGGPLAACAAYAAAAAPESGLSFLVAGPRHTDEELRRCAFELGSGARCLVLRCRPAADPALRSLGSTALGTVGALADLPAIVARFTGGSP